MNWEEAEKRLTESLVTIYDEGEAAAIAGWVVEHFSSLKRADRLLKNKTCLAETEIAELDRAQERLLKAEPVQYVLNESWFSGLKFFVDNNVLIPRPETEELVEWVISDCKFPIASLRILDIGSGSGCIPVSLKRRIRKADVWGCDISTGALAVANKNAATLGTEVNFLPLDFLDRTSWSRLPLVDIITSNPPYIPESDKATMHDNVLAFEPHMALFVPNNDPLLFYKAIAALGKTHLEPGGSIYLEIHESLGTAVVDLYTNEGYKTILKKDMQGKDRMVKAWL